MGEFALGQPVPRFEDPRLLRGGGRYVDDMVLPRMASAMCCARPTRMRASARSIRVRGQGGAGGAGGTDRRGLGSLGLGRPADARAGSSGATARPRTGRAFRRWSTTGCAGSAITSPLSSPRPRHQAADAAELIDVDYEPLPAIVSTADAVEPGAPLVWDDCRGQHLLSSIPRAIAAATDAAFADADHVVRRRFVINRVTAASDGAARRDRRLQPGRGPLHHLHHPAARARLPRRAGAAGAEGAGKPDARRRRRYRRQLRHEIGDLQRGRAGAARLENARPAGQMDQHALARPSSATRRPATTSPRPSWRSTTTDSSSACASRRSPLSAPIRRPAPTPLSPISAPWPASIARRRCMPR